MKNRYALFNGLLIFVLAHTCFSCSRQPEANGRLAQAESIVEQQPDSALRLLQSVLFPENLDKSRFNKYNLLLLEAKDKDYKDITSDTIIFAVKDYYLQKKDYSNAAMATYYCGRLWHERNNMEEAVKAYMEAENLAGKTDNNNLKGLIQSNLGILHRYHSSYDKAIVFAKNAVRFYDKAKNYKNEISTQVLIGICFMLKNQIDSSFYYYNESLKLAVLHNMQKLQSDVKENIGLEYREQGYYDKAKQLFHEALALPNDSLEQARILLNIAQVYGLENNSDSVNFYLNKALALHISDPWIVRSSYLLKYTIAEKNSQFQEALNDYKEYYNYTIKVFDSAKNNQLLEVQGKYDYEKLKNVDSQLIINQLIVVIILAFALIAAGIVIFIYYWRYAKNKNLLLESEQKIENLQQMANDSSNDKNSSRHILLEHFNILRKAALIETELNDSEKKSGAYLLHKFNQIVYGQDAFDWNTFYESINTLQNGFYDKVRAEYPKWNETEFRVFCLTYENQFRDKEIAIILNRSVQMIRKVRNTIKKDVIDSEYHF